MERSQFEKLVAEALRSIPKRFRKEMRNIAIIVEDEPSKALLHGFEFRYPDLESALCAIFGRSN